MFRQAFIMKMVILLSIANIEEMMMLQNYCINCLGERHGFHVVGSVLCFGI